MTVAEEARRLMSQWFAYYRALEAADALDSEIESAWRKYQEYGRIWVQLARVPPPLTWRRIGAK